MDLPNEVVKRIFVVVPEGFELVSGREFVAAQFQCDFEAVGCQVVEVLHAFEVSKRGKKSLSTGTI